MNGYVAELLQGWEEVYKKGQFTLWVLVSLAEGSKDMSAIKHLISELTNGTVSVDDKSLYRALRRFNDAEMVTFSKVPGNKGPDRKEYRLTTVGREVLKNFAERNITNIYYKPDIRHRIEEI